MTDQPLLFDLPGRDCLPGQLGFDFEDDADAAISAGELVNHAEELAPVSAARCRSCGHNARRDAPSATWYLEHKAAYCPECWKRR